MNRVNEKQVVKCETVLAFRRLFSAIAPGSRQDAAKTALLAEIRWHRKNSTYGASYSRHEKRFLRVIEQAFTEAP